MNVMKLFLILLFIPSCLLAQTIEYDSLDFGIQPDGMNYHSYYALRFLSYKDSLPDVLKQFDVEDFKNGRNQFVYSKSTFLINKKLSEIDRSSFTDEHNLERVLDARMVSRNGSNSWNYEMTMALKKVKFKLHVVVDDQFADNSLAGDYSLITDLFDTNLERRSYFVTQVLDHFSTGLKRMIVVSKLIPYGNQTLVVSYHLTIMDYKWFKKYNIFHVVEKIFKKKILSSLQLTKELMEE